MSVHSSLYRGRLMHARNDAHARRAFRYPVFVASLDLDELDVLHRDLRLFSHGGRNVFSFHDEDYAATLSPSARGLVADIPHSTLQMNALDESYSWVTDGPEVVVTMRSVRNVSSTTREGSASSVTSSTLRYSTPIHSGPFTVSQ